MFIFICLEHRGKKWGGAKMGIAEATEPQQKRCQLRAMAELVRKYPKRSPFSMQSKRKQA